MAEQKWLDAKDQIAAFQNYVTVNSLPATTERAYLVKREEIDRLLDQKPNATLDGIRIYLGFKTVNNVLVPTATVVATEKDINGNYNDYNIPAIAAVGNRNASTNDGPDDDPDGDPNDDAEDGMAIATPCPSVCGDQNDLNS